MLYVRAFQLMNLPWVRAQVAGSDVNMQLLRPAAPKYVPPSDQFRNNGTTTQRMVPTGNRTGGRN
jgi:hypothetical protein